MQRFLTVVEIPTEQGTTTSAAKSESIPWETLKHQMSNLNLAQFEEIIWAKRNTSQFPKASSITKIKSSPSLLLLVQRN